MPRRFAPPALGLIGCLVLSAAPVLARDQESPKLAEARRFLKGLRERGFHDLVPVYADRFRSGNTPEALRTLLDFEEAMSLADQANTQNDMGRRATLLEAARAKIEAFAKAHEDQPSGVEALVELARIYVERGHIAAHQAREAVDPANARGRETEARTFYDQSRGAYGRAIDRLRSTYDTLPKTFLADDDPRKRQREELLRSLLNAELQRALVEYEDAQTFPIDFVEPKADRERNEKERNRRLDQAIGMLEDLYHRHREQMAGLYARKWQGKCLEEKGELGKAMGIYKELMDQPDPQLKPLQQEVAYYQIIVSNKRKEYPVAAEKAAAWLKANGNGRNDNDSLATRLGVMLEKSRALLSQKPNLDRDRERDAIDTLNQVLKYSSPYKNDAVRLLAQNRPKSDKPVTIPANITYDNARKEGDQAINLQEWDKAIAYLKAAVRTVDPAKDPDKANEARIRMAYAYFQDGRYYEAGIIGEHIARRYPKFERAAQAAEFALSAWYYAYTNLTEGDRSGDLNRLLDLSKYVITAFPDTEQEQMARLTIGDVALGQGRYAESAEMLEGIPGGSPRWLEARSRAAQARWRLSLKLREENQKEPADEQAKKAIDLYKQILQARKEAGATPGDAGMIGNASDLADLYLATEQPTEALALLDPVVKGAVGADSAEAGTQPITRLLSIQLRAHIAAGQTDAAIEDMRTLEKVGGQGAPLTQLYFNLGRLLQKELDNLKAKGDQEKFKQTQLAYVKFLEALAASKSGQNYDSLQWAGEAMLSMGLADQSIDIFKRVYDTYSQDATFKATPNSEARLVRTQLKLITARRAKADKASFEKALAEVETLIKDHPKALDPLLERCRTLEDWAEVEKTPERWDKAIGYWKQLATLLNKSKSPEQYEAWYHVGYCQMKKGSKQEAVRTLKGILALSPKLNGDEMVKKYKDLLKQLGQ